MEYTVIKNHKIYYKDNNDPVIHFLKRGVLYGEGNYKLLNSWLKGKSHILDCGAHIGTFSLPAALDGHHLTIIEGAQDNVECLRNTFADISNVHVINGMISDIVGPCSFSTTHGPFGHLIKDPDGKYQSITIDALINDTKVHAIKLDLEGGEIEALEGAKETITKNKPVMLIEVNGHCLRQSGRLPQELIAKIESLEYDVFAPEYLNLKVTSKHMFPFCVTDVLCFPRGQMSAREFTEKEIKNLAYENYLRSNDDCKEYFTSIGVY